MTDPSSPIDDPLAALNEAMGSVTASTEISSIEELRAWSTSMEFLIPTDLPPLGRFDDALVLGEVDGRQVVADLMAPEGDGPLPVIVYLHGGGWVLGSRTTYRPAVARMALAGNLVISVDYGLAPEDPFPAGFDDCAFAVRWAAEHAAEHGGDPSHLVVAGDSAGANLTAAVAAAFADDATAPAIESVVLLYGVFDQRTMPRGDTPTSGELVDKIRDAYLGADAERLVDDPRVSPLHVAAKLPPAFVAVGTADDLVGQSRQLAEALAAAGTVHEHVEVPDMPHAFVQLPLPQAIDTIDRAMAFIAAQRDGDAG